MPFLKPPTFSGNIFSFRTIIGQATKTGILNIVLRLISLLRGTVPKQKGKDIKQEEKQRNKRKKPETGKAEGRQRRNKKKSVSEKGAASRGFRGHDGRGIPQGAG